LPFAVVNAGKVGSSRPDCGVYGNRHLAAPINAWERNNEAADHEDGYESLKRLSEQWFCPRATNIPVASSRCGRSRNG
jgi:hypothetical protein